MKDITFNDLSQDKISKVDISHKPKAIIDDVWLVNTTKAMLKIRLCSDHAAKYYQTFYRSQYRMLIGSVHFPYKAIDRHDYTISLRQRESYRVAYL